MERIVEFERDLMRKALGEPATHPSNQIEGESAVSGAREPADAE